MFFSRGPNKVQNPYTMKDFYAFYTQDVDENEVYDVEYKEYSEIVNKFYKGMMNHILLEAGTIRMSFGLGDLFVSKEKIHVNAMQNPRRIDWKLTNETGKRVYHLNEHSDGYKYVFHWDKVKSRVKKLRLYRLQTTRSSKRLLAQLIKSGEYDYYEKR